jgi:Phospholipase_D-nuclease N-terminal
MKIVIEILIAIVLHPIAVILVWLDLLGRSDIGRSKKVLWAVVALVWGIGPILYIFLGDGDLW